MADKKTIEMRVRGQKGLLFAENKLLSPGNVKTYFPQFEGESAEDYKSRQKYFIAAPVVSAILGRIVGSLHKKPRLIADDDAQQALLQVVLDAVGNWPVLSRAIARKALAGGQCLVVIRIIPEGVKLESWSAPYVFKEGDSIGYEYYKTSKGTIRPVLSEEVTTEARETWRRVEINDREFRITTKTGTEIVEHNLGVCPAEMFYAPDYDTQDSYAAPYPERIWDLVPHLNQTLSQANYSIHALQNVWETDLPMPESTVEPLKIRPGYVNYLDEGHHLKQIIRELNLTPEWDQVRHLRQMIAEAGQVPGFFTGLESLKEMPSGRALERLMEPYAELMDCIRPSFGAPMERLAEKMIIAQSHLTGKPIQEAHVVRHVDQNIIPPDVDKELERIKDAEDRRYITSDEAKQRARTLLGYETE